MFRRLWKFWTRIPPAFRRASTFIFLGILIGRIVLPVVGGVGGDLYESFASTPIPIEWAIVLIFVISVAIWGVFETRNEGYLENQEKLRKDLDDIKIELHSSKTENKNKEKLIQGLNLDMDLDHVTGILNERKFWLDINYEIKEGESGEFCLIYIDVDNFKEIDNEILFLKANTVLRKIAQGIEIEMRRNESIWRRSEAYRKNTGGDEFIIYLRGSEEDGVKFMKFRLPKIFNMVSDDLVSTINGRRLTFSGAMKVFSGPEVTKLRSMDHVESVVNAELVKLHQGTIDGKKGKYGFWFTWSSLPLGVFGSDAERNLSEVKDDTQRELLSFLRIDKKSEVFASETT